MDCQKIFTLSEVDLEKKEEVLEVFEALYFTIHTQIIQIWLGIKL